MNTAAQKNEIAGSTVQELPPVELRASSATQPAAGGLAPGFRLTKMKTSGAADDAGPVTRIVLPIDFAPEKDNASQWMLAGAAVKGAGAPTLTTNAGINPAPPAAALAPVERMISREVTMVRQSGAEALAVTLKVDSRTSLFLQLTNHNGQIEASVRCEKGDAGALAGQWGQLQDSLARQNVQLLPLEEKGTPPQLPENAAQNDFNPPPRPQPQASHAAGPEPEVPTDEAMSAAVGLSKHKSKTHSRHGWEKWA